MAEALVSTILEQLASILKVRPDSKILPEHSKILHDLTTKFEGILPLLQDAEIRQVKDKNVKAWLDTLKDTSYEIEDALDEWSTRMEANKSKPWKKHLPAIGELPCLESLYIANMKNVKRVGKEFSGKEKETDGPSTSNGTGTGTFFPSLRTLKFESMDEWEIWEDTIMPGLQSLTIGHCRKLKALPEIAPSAKILGATTLKKLSMHNCSRLNERYNKNTGEKWSIISEIPNIKIDGEHVKKTTIEFPDAKV